MADEQLPPDSDQLGPMDYAAVEFPGGRITGDGFRILLDLADRGSVRILDLEFVTRTSDGSIEVVDIAALDTEPGVDLTPFAGASSGILDRVDLDEVGGNIRQCGSGADLRRTGHSSGVRRLAAHRSAGCHRRTHHS